MAQMSVTKVIVPLKTCAQVELSSASGALLWMVSVAASSGFYFTFIVVISDQNVFFRMAEEVILPYWIEDSNVFLIMSIGN